MSGIMLAGGGGNRFTVTIGPGSTVAGKTAGRTFASNTVVVSGAVGALTYLWGYIDRSSGLFTWSIANGTTATATLSTNGYASGDIGDADLYCVVTDSTGASVTSSTARYEYQCNDTGVVNHF